MVKRLLACALALPLLIQGHVMRVVVLCQTIGLVSVVGRLAQAKVFLTQDAALQLAFPQAERVDRKTLYLSSDQARQIEQKSKARVDSSVISYYEGWQGKTKMGTAFFDTRLVRTMPMTTMTVVKPDGSIGFIEVLSFHEPEDYLPRPRWLSLFRGKAMRDPLRLRRDIPNVTGATMTALAISDSARTQLALYEVLP